jgi:CDP-paratose 2-epimerase
LIKEYSYLFNLKFIINRCGVISGPWQFGKQEQGLFSFWVKKHILKKNLKYIGYGGYGNQVRDVLHIDDFNNLILKQIKNLNIINNVVLNVGGGSKNKISLLNLTKACEKLTNNICKKTKKRKTSNYDIPYYVTDNKKVTNFYNWTPKKSVNTLLEDLYIWMMNNKKLINRF